MILSIAAGRKLAKQNYHPKFACCLRIVYF